MTIVSTRAWQRMLSGRRLDLLDPRPSDIAIEDIAHGLARVARWNGQTLGAHIFSVAQHSLLVESIFAEQMPSCTPEDSLAALLHDAAEYVVGDLISPFKAALGGGYTIVEQRVLAAVQDRFGLVVTDDLARCIKTADRTAARCEAVQLAGFAEVEATLFFGEPYRDAPHLADLLRPWPADEVQTRFLHRFSTLTTRAGSPA